MKKTLLLIATIAIAILAATIVSCKKEIAQDNEYLCNNHESTEVSREGEVLSSRGSSNPPPIFTINVLDSLELLTKFEDYDFPSYRRDTTDGNDIVYIIPNKYFEDFDYLYVICDHEGGVTVWELIVPDGDQGYNYFYQGNPCYFTFYDFDTGITLISGYGDYFNDAITVTYYNSTYFNGDRQQGTGGNKPWLCGMSMGVVGGIWSAAAGLVTLGAGFIVGLGFTALGIWVCNS